jgi:uncharacterized protein
MNYYIDTCVIISAVQVDAHTERICDWLSKRRASELVTSDWTLTETPSALGRLVRMKDISAEAAQTKWRDVQTWLADEFHVETPISSDFRKAAEYQTAWSLGLRAGDALHLAIADRLGITVVTTDYILAQACSHYNVSILEI